jgi:hypothetical protein
MDMIPLIKIKGRDKSVEGKLNSLINVVNERGEKLDEGALQRYLAEIVWSPSFVISPLIE